MRDNYDAMLRAVIGRCVWSIRVRVHGNFNVARGFVGLMPRKKSPAGAIYKEEKWRNGDRKSSWQLENL